MPNGMTSSSDGQLSAHLPEASETDRSCTSPFLGTNTAAGLTFALWGLETSRLHYSPLGKIPTLSPRTRHTLPFRKCPANGKAKRIPLVTPQAIAPLKAWTDCSLPLLLRPREEALHFTMLTADANASPWCLRVDHFRDFIGGKPIPAC